MWVLVCKVLRFYGFEFCVCGLGVLGFRVLGFRVCSLVRVWGSGLSDTKTLNAAKPKLCAP